VVCVRAHEAISPSLHSDRVMVVLAIFLAAAAAAMMSKSMGMVLARLTPAYSPTFSNQKPPIRHSYLLSSLPNLPLLPLPHQSRESFLRLQV
jgi:hypothetical protein